MWLYIKVNFRKDCISESQYEIKIGGDLMNMQYLWLAVGIVGILGAIVPAAQMGTEIYFDFQLFMLVVGIGAFYVIGSGGTSLKMIDNFGKGSFAAGSLGFFIALASVPGSQGQALIDTTQYAVFSIGLGTIIHLVCQVIVNRFSASQ
jgi:hypothetical protein|tara:strand:- start:159 stop:602 length:444 start_codon:yes stop_codon:yes gene_type:complete